MTLEPALPLFRHAQPLNLVDWPVILADRQTGNGRFLVLGDFDGPHHLWLPHGRADVPLAHSIPRDRFSMVRHYAAARLDRRLAGAPPARGDILHRPTFYQRSRLALLLSIIDFADAGTAVTTREIAGIIFPHTRFANGLEWKSSNERRRTQRLTDEARRLVAGGYRGLLCGTSSVRQK